MSNPKLLSTFVAFFFAIGAVTSTETSSLDAVRARYGRIKSAHLKSVAQVERLSLAVVAAAARLDQVRILGRRERLPHQLFVRLFARAGRRHGGRLRRVVLAAAGDRRREANPLGRRNPKRSVSVPQSSVPPGSVFGRTRAGMRNHMHEPERSVRQRWDGALPSASRRVGRVCDRRPRFRGPVPPDLRPENRQPSVAGALVPWRPEGDGGHGRRVFADGCRTTRVANSGAVLR